MSRHDILTDLTDGVATVTLNRPERMNALTRETEARLEGALRTLGEDRSARVILLTGAGRAFCSGRDVAKLDDSPLLKDPSALPPDFTYFTEIPKPIIAVINGPLAGSGFILALASDLRFIGSDAFFTASFSRLGLPAEGGLSWLLPRLVGQGKAMDILFTSRRIQAKEALALGLVERMFQQNELIASAMKYGRELAIRSPESLAMIKQQGWNAWGQSLPEAFEEARVKLQVALASEDFKEGVAALREKRKPNF